MRTLETLMRPWIRRFTIIISVWLRTSSLFSGQEFKEIQRALDHWKLVSKYGFLQANSSYRNKKCADHPTLSNSRCLVTER